MNFLISKNHFPVAPVPNSPNDNGLKVLLGCIRWDAWVHNGDPNGTDLELIMKDAQYDDRIPFYGVISNAGNANRSVVMDSRPRSVTDQENIAARDLAKVGYWAFNTYEPDSALSISCINHMQSTVAGKPNMTHVVFCANLIGDEFRTWLVNLICHSNYQTLNGRPLLFILGCEYHKQWILDAYGSNAAFAQELEKYWAAVQARGRQRPYVVFMEVDPTIATFWCNTLGGDAISTYTTGLPDGAPGTHPVYPYTQLATATEGHWTHQAATSPKPVIPLINSGWNSKPLQECVPAIPSYEQTPGRSYSGLTTPAALQAHVENGLQFAKQEQSSWTTKTALLYSWNELAEGGQGAICPKLNPAYDVINAVGAAMLAQS